MSTFFFRLIPRCCFAMRTNSYILLSRCPSVAATKTSQKRYALFCFHVVSLRIGKPIVKLISLTTRSSWTSRINPRSAHQLSSVWRHQIPRDLSRLRRSGGYTSSLASYPHSLHSHPVSSSPPHSGHMSSRAESLRSSGLFIGYCVFIFSP